METVPISVAKAKLSEIVDEAVATHQQVTITKNGSRAAVLVSAEEWDEIEETLYWSAQPHIHADVAEGRAAYADGETSSLAEVRNRLGR